MHELRLFWLLTLQLIYSSTFAQGEANNWYFGENAGLDFNSGSPIAITDGQMYAFEGSAVMSDANGELLFYTNGVTVWNRNHDTLSNGAGLQGGLSSTQSSLIIPKPGSTSIFYIFTTSQTQQAGNWNFCYSEVDMTLDGGLGGITANKNVFLYTPIGEKITAVKHANNTDIWVITHAKFTNAYLTYSVTSAGVNSNPIIFNGGTTDNGTGDGYSSPNWGYMKASPDGSKIAAAFFVVNRTDVLDFNKTTGQLSFRFTINQVVSPYGVEFSPNSSLLYVSSYFNSALRQYNLDLSTPTEIISNSVNIPSTNGTFALQLGPDEKIYIACAGQTFLDCIQTPNQVGLNCNFLSNAVSLNGATYYLGLPNFAPYLLTPSGIEHLGFCSNDTTFFTFLNGAQADSVLWDFGDPNSGVLNTSNSLTPFHLYQNNGNYTVSVTTFQGLFSNTVSKPITIFPVPSISLGTDIEFCYDVMPMIGVLNPDPSYIYSWTLENQTYPFPYNYSAFFINNPGNYTVTASNNCGTASDTILANRIIPPVNFDLGEDVTFCEGNQVYLSTSNQADVDYLWQDGSTEPFYAATSTGAYILQLSNICGNVSDTVIVTVIPLPLISLGTDTLFCNGDTLKITPTGVFDAYVWQNGLLNEPLTVNIPGIYYAYATTVCGETIDSIIVTEIAAPIDIDFGSGLSFCEGTPFSLNASQANVSYQWQDGSTDSVFNVTQGGTYSVTLVNQCGSASDTTFVTVNPLPTVSLGPDTITCVGNPIQLNATGNADTYSWQDGTTNSNLIVNTTGMYSIMATNNCGVATDTIFVNFGASSISSINLSDCEPITLNGVTYSTSGQYTQVLQNASGCDSILNIEAEIQNFNAQIFQTDSMLYVNGTPTSIQWINCTTGQAIPGATQTSFVPQTSGNYGAVITIGECVDTSNCRQIIQSSAPKKPGSLCDNLIVTPNPVQDQIEVTLDKSSYDIKLFTSSGALLTSTIGGKEKQNIYMDNFAAAMYILQIDQCFFKIMKSR